MSLPARRVVTGQQGLQTAQIVRTAHHDEEIAALDCRVRRWIEYHLAGGPAHGHDDDADFLAKVHRLDRFADHLAAFGHANLFDRDILANILRSEIQEL